MATTPSTGIDTEQAVRERYSEGALAVQPALCCPVDYAALDLDFLPREILERDYGCGDPTPYVREGDTVLDLGSGGGKLCYIASRAVGPSGRVIGVDCNAEMLDLARRHQTTVAERLGFSNVEFRCGMIQDLQLDLDELSEALSDRPVQNCQDWLELRSVEDRLRREQPMIEDESVDCVISNCVLNLVRSSDRVQLFQEIYRILRDGGRAVISDIVCDEDVPTHLQDDPELWSGCISGAFREDLFIEAFAQAGFHGMTIVARQSEPWQTVEGIEFRSLTIQAYKGKEGPCLERRQALVYRGPFQSVKDDDGHSYERGQRTAVCDKTFHLLQREPYTGMFEPVEPRSTVAMEDATDFDCSKDRQRAPSETKGPGYDLTIVSDGSCCGPGEDCC